MRREKVEGLVLSRRNVGEADRLVTIFSREAGLLRAVAKGVRKIPSRRGGHLEPLTKISAIVHGSSSRHYIAAVETLDYYSELSYEGADVEQARRMSSLLLHFFEEGEELPSLYDALVQAWEVLPSLSVSKKLLLESAFSLLVVKEAGLLLQLSACQMCSKRVPEEAVVLDWHEGGWRCITCHDGFVGTDYSLSPRLFKVVRYIATYPERSLRLKVSEAEAEQIAGSVLAYVAGIVDDSTIKQQWAPSSFTDNQFATYG